MLSDTLLDSSPAREPVLHGGHWLFAAAAAIAAFCLSYFGLPLVETPQARVLVTQASVLAAAAFFSALMLGYVYADSHRLGLRTWLWMMLTFILSIAGFIAYLVYTAARTGDWKRTTLPVAYMIEVIAIGVMIIIPLVRTEALPKASFDFISIPIPPSPPPAAASPRVVVHAISLTKLETEPIVIPKIILRLKYPTTGPSGNIEAIGVQGGLHGDLPDGVIKSVMNMSGMQAPPPVPKPHAPKVVRRGGDVEQAMLIYGPKPVYPQLAQMARIQGTVRLDALIAADGAIKGLKVISGHPLLVNAALQAVEHWRYQPTLLNGQPVEVQTEIDVHFFLGN